MKRVAVIFVLLYLPCSHALSQVEYCKKFLDCENDMMDTHKRCTDGSRNATAEACDLVQDFSELSKLMRARVNEFGACVSAESFMQSQRSEEIEIDEKQCELDPEEFAEPPSSCWKSVAQIKRKCQKFQRCCPAAKVCVKSGKNSQVTRAVREKHVIINHKTLDCREKMRWILRTRSDHNDPMVAKARAVLTSQGIKFVDKFRAKETEFPTDLKSNMNPSQPLRPIQTERRPVNDERRGILKQLSTLLLPKDDSEVKIRANERLSRFEQALARVEMNSRLKKKPILHAVKSFLPQAGSKPIHEGRSRYSEGSSPLPNTVLPTLRPITTTTEVTTTTETASTTTIISSTTALVTERSRRKHKKHRKHKKNFSTGLVTDLEPQKPHVSFALPQNLDLRRLRLLSARPHLMKDADKRRVWPENKVEKLERMGESEDSDEILHKTTAKSMETTTQIPFEVRRMETTATLTHGEQNIRIIEDAETNQTAVLTHQIKEEPSINGDKISVHEDTVTKIDSHPIDGMSDHKHKVSVLHEDTLTRHEHRKNNVDQMMRERGVKRIQEMNDQQATTTSDGVPEEDDVFGNESGFTRYPLRQNGAKIHLTSKTVTLKPLEPEDVGLRRDLEPLQNANTTPVEFETGVFTVRPKTKPPFDPVMEFLKRLRNPNRHTLPDRLKQVRTSKLATLPIAETTTVPNINIMDRTVTPTMRPKMVDGFVTFENDQDLLGARLKPQTVTPTVNPEELKEPETTTTMTSEDTTVIPEGNALNAMRTMAEIPEWPTTVPMEATTRPTIVKSNFGKNRDILRRQKIVRLDHKPMLTNVAKPFTNRNEKIEEDVGYRNKVYSAQKLLLSQPEQQMTEEEALLRLQRTKMPDIRRAPAQNGTPVKPAAAEELPGDFNQAQKDLIRNLEEFVNRKVYEEAVKDRVQHSESELLQSLRRSRSEFEIIGKRTGYCELYSTCSDLLKSAERECRGDELRFPPELARRKFGSCNAKLWTQYQDTDKLRLQLVSIFESCLVEDIATGRAGSPFGCSADWPTLPEFPAESTCTQRTAQIRDHCVRLGKCCDSLKRCRQVTDQNPLSQQLFDAQQDLAHRAAKCQSRGGGFRALKPIEMPTKKVLLL
ncbi:unnamed protein product [Bursaphelenchus xylophilus]|nr:unnamed protein product [Bursaphelenchus xylophilus]CAG9099859.1 unnamed protein product [Bursaphelenchus xylophilus]